MSEKFKNIFKYSNEGLLVVDSSGVIETVNPRVIEMFGYNVESDLIGKKMEILVPSQIKHSHVAMRDGFMQCPSNRAIGQGNVLWGERKDGTQFPVDVSLSHYKKDDELKVIAFVVDITKRIAIENELKELNNELENKVIERTKEIDSQNQLLKSIAKNFPNGNIYVINDEYTIEWADGKLLRNVGLTDTSLVGMSFMERLSNDVKNIIGTQLKILFNGKTIKFEIEDKEKHFSIYGVSLTKENNRVNKALLVEMDITAEKNYEQAMKENLLREKRLNELKSRFVSMASHEFRTPLSTINSSAVLIDKYEDDKFKLKRKSHVLRIKKMVSNLTIILNDFLSLEKLESGKVNFTKTEDNLIPFLEQIIEQINTIKKDSQTVIYECENESIFINTDFNILQNCIYNLLSNAVKYSPSTGEIKIVIRETANQVSLNVIDQGIGIPTEDQPRLFTRFHRAENVTNIEGTGLGLNIVKRYMDVLGGEISFKSELNVGSNFCLTIPKK